MQIGLGLSILGKVLSALKSHHSNESKGAGIFGKIDADGNGGISKAELSDFQSMLAKEVGIQTPTGFLDQIFDKLDGDGNGELTPAEMKASREAMQERMHNLSASSLIQQLINKLDKNGDGELSKEELQAAMKGLQDGYTGPACVCNGPTNLMEFLSTQPQGTAGV